MWFFFPPFLRITWWLVALHCLLNLVLLIQFDLAYYISSVYPITGVPILITTKVSQQIQCNTCQNSSTILFSPKLTGYLTCSMLLSRCWLLSEIIATICTYADRILHQVLRTLQKLRFKLCNSVTHTLAVTNSSVIELPNFLQIIPGAGNAANYSGLMI